MLFVLLLVAFCIPTLFAQKVLRLADLQSGDLEHTKQNWSIIGTELKNKKKFIYGVGLGYNFKSLRFETKYDFEEVAGELQLIELDDPSFEFPDELFRNGFSALNGHYIRLAPVAGYGNKKKIYIFTGPLIDVRIGARHRVKYFIGDTKNSNRTSGNHLLQLRTWNLGWRVGIGIANGFSINYEFAGIKFLRDAWDSDIRFTGVSFVFGV